MRSCAVPLLHGTDVGGCRPPCAFLHPCLSCCRCCRPACPFLHASPFWHSSTLACPTPPLHLGPPCPSPPPMLKTFWGGSVFPAQRCPPGNEIQSLRPPCAVLHTDCPVEEGAVFHVPPSGCSCAMLTTQQHLQPNGNEPCPQPCSLHCSMSPRLFSTPFFTFSFTKCPRRVH